MKANEYQDAIAKYLAQRYADDGLEVFTEVQLGTSIVGKKRKIDVLILEKDTGKSFGLECKVQMVGGTAEEKLYFAIEDIKAMPIPGAVVYYGGGFTEAFLHMLAASPHAVYCKPPGCDEGKPETDELDTLLDIHFGLLRRRIPDDKKITP
jgi:hypothetical protein